MTSDLVKVSKISGRGCLKGTNEKVGNKVYILDLKDVKLSYPRITFCALEADEPISCQQC